MLNKQKLIIILMAFIYSNTKAETYYVTLSGNNTNNGLTETAAWHTFSYAASSTSPVVAGDTVYIKAGNYGLDNVLIDKNYSINDAPISFIGYQNSPGDITNFSFNYGDNVQPSIMPLIDPGNRTNGTAIGLYNIHNIIIKNIQIANSYGGISVWNSSSTNSNHIFENIFLKNIGWDYTTAIAIKEANEIIVRNCLVVNATGAGMDIWGNENIIDKCKIYSNESQEIDDGTFTSMDYYIVIKGNNNIITNCYAERIGDLVDVGHGLEIKENGTNNLFINCDVKNMIAGCFSVRWSAVQNNTFKNCTAIGGISDDVSAFMIRDGASSNFFDACVSKGCETGIKYIFTGEDANANYCGNNNTFNNCIITNAIYTIYLDPYSDSSATVNSNSIVNCVIDDADYLLNCNRTNNGNIFINSIITDIEHLYTGNKTSNYKYLYCDFYNNGFSMPTGDGNITTDPLFKNKNIGDYHLSELSPAIDAGTNTYLTTVDMDNIMRPKDGNNDGNSCYDIGCYEYIYKPNGTLFSLK